MLPRFNAYGRTKPQKRAGPLRQRPEKAEFASSDFETEFSDPACWRKLKSHQVFLAVFELWFYSLFDSSFLLFYRVCFMTFDRQSVRLNLACMVALVPNNYSTNYHLSRSTKYKSGLIGENGVNTRGHLQSHGTMKKAPRETQTLRAGCIKAEPKIFASQEGQNLISWRSSLPLPTDPVW